MVREPLRETDWNGARDKKTFRCHVRQNRGDVELCSDVTRSESLRAPPPRLLLAGWIVLKKVLPHSFLL